MKTVIKALGAGAVLLLVIGCSATDPPLGPTVLSAWGGSLAPTSGPDPSIPLLAGNVAALVRENGTEANIALREFEAPDLELEWGLYNGLCGDAGDLVGDAASYPPLSDSQLEATSFLSGQLVEGASYHASVRDAASGDELACGNLSETEL